MAKKRRMGAPRRPPDGRESFRTRLKPETVTRLRELGQGWANRGIEFLLKSYETHDEVR